MSITLTEAAEKTGVSKSTLTRKIKAGDLSATRSDDNKTYLVDEAELTRVYPLVSVHHDESQATPNSPNASPPHPDHAVLQLKLDMLEQQLEHERQSSRRQIEDLQGQRDRWQKEAEDWKQTNANNQVLLLTHESNQPKRAGLLSALFGR